MCCVFVITLPSRIAYILLATYHLLNSIRKLWFACWWLVLSPNSFKNLTIILSSTYYFSHHLEILFSQLKAIYLFFKQMYAKAKRIWSSNSWTVWTMKASWINSLQKKKNLRDFWKGCIPFVFYFLSFFHFNLLHLPIIFRFVQNFPIMLAFLHIGKNKKTLFYFR